MQYCVLFIFLQDLAVSRAIGEYFDMLASDERAVHATSAADSQTALSAFVDVVSQCTVALFAIVSSSKPSEMCVTAVVFRQKTISNRLDVFVLCRG